MTMAASFARSGMARLVNTTGGRLVRIVVGVGLIGWGYTQRGSTTGIVLIVAGLIPLAAGSFNWCLISGLLGGPLNGDRVVGRKP